MSLRSHMLCHQRNVSATDTALRRPQSAGHSSRSRRTPLTMAVAQATKPLTKADLVQYMESGCRPTDQFRFGTEHEKLGYNTDFTRLPYEKIRYILERLCSRFGWAPILEAGNIIGAKLDGQSVTIEPGGQFELSGAPVDTLHKTCSEVNSHLYQVKTIATEVGAEFLGLGFDPKWKVEEVPIMPKERYRIMRAYMPTRGQLGHDMMFRSCTIQVNLDFESEQDMVEKLRVGLALQPVATALFANSPFRDGEPTGYLSWRAHVWEDTDPDRTGTLPFVWEEGFGFASYVDYALTVPMYFVYRQGCYINAAGQSFKDFMQGDLPSLPGELPTLADWEQHLSTIFPEVRLKKFLEMRGADGGPWRNICALSALWVGLLYDRQSQAEALQLVSEWSQADREYLRSEVPKTALHTEFRGGKVQDLAKEVLKLARAGLERRDKGEEKFLEPLEAIAESGVTAAEELLQKYHEQWGGSIEPVFSDKDYVY